MSGARRRFERSRRYVEEGEEPEINPEVNLLIQMLQKQQAMHRQYREQQAQAERHHKEMMHVLQQQRVQPQPQPEQRVKLQAPRGDHVFREFCRMNPPTFKGQYEPTEASE
ncbi:hypothetical protein A2U01_0027215 [Trifolium medium]|uniref:Uncharacterized protein n=1 Tax=Trifolium medium TaxID=97028 RepID=A0A392P2D2_9FABA|nr:hypothetical protein [Trifolium medium]